MRIARGRVLEVTARRDGFTRLKVQVDGATAEAVAFDAFGAPPEPGQDVLLNTTAVDLGLGTGGVHLVIPSGEAEREDHAGHAIKLRYTPLQIAVEVFEEGRADRASDLGGVPVVAIFLHSALVPAALGARWANPAATIAYVMTDAAALPLAFSESVAAARSAGLIDLTVTSGQAFGGDLEAVGLYSAIDEAASRADVVICGMGPGNLGTGSRLGFAALEVGQVVNAASGLGARPIVAPRISFADPRARHRGFSHHTQTAMSVAAIAPAEIAVPSLEGAERRTLLEAAAVVRAGRHQILEVKVPIEVLGDSPVAISSMGRALADDPAHFLAAAAAGALAAGAPAAEPLA